MTVNMTPELNRHNELITPRLQLVAWEVTRSCNLSCAHCRASATGQQYQDELSTAECFRLVDQIAEVGKPILILTGGEPLMRDDVFSIGKYASAKGMRVVMGTNGTLIDAHVAARLKDIPLSRAAISLDFPTAELQDNFRGKKGAFEAAIAGLGHVRRAGIEAQINCTITRLNVDYLADLVSLSLELGAVALHPFLLVPTGRGKGLESQELSPAQYEETLNWIYDRQLELKDKIFFKPTDAPHYTRIISQRKKLNQGNCQAAPETSQRPHGHNAANAITRGCLAGTGFCFVSHRGKVQGCGYLNLEAGDVRKQSFKQIWEDSVLFNQLRDLSCIKGKCGACEYKKLCGGCRARALESTGDHLEAEPYCTHQPVAWPGKAEGVKS
jgi:AdoMet-dependent heme synthase